MGNTTHIIFTAGRGPLECSLAVYGIQNRFKKYLDTNNIKYDIVSQHKGNIMRSLETILFSVHTTDSGIIDPWIGTHLWICKSPIRKFHKRKNWYIKCQNIDIQEATKLSLKDVKIQSFRASGPGGQHRNKVETAIRIIHNESKIMVTATDGKSQSQNKKKAMAKLRLKLKTISDKTLQQTNSDQWTSQIKIERGNPSKIFVCEKFKEK